MDDMELLSIAEKYFLGDVNIAKIWFKKYGINGETPVDIWKRLAKLTSEMEKEENQKEWDGNFYDLLKDWKFVPGGRILFALTEDIKNKTGRRKITPFNCFVLPSPEDNLESIFDIVQKAARVYSYGGGVGIDLSKIRPAGSKVNNSAIYSDGVVPFMNLYSAVTTNIAISGRRGAMLLSISDKSPDLINFINAKKDHTKINSANISIKLSDAFMKAVETDGDWETYFKVKDSGEEIKQVHKARTIFNNIIENNWKSAEPGVLFWDKILHWTPNEYFDESPLIGTNPCVIGSTVIATADGRNGVTIQELANNGNPVPVYSRNLKTGIVEIKMAKKIRKTGEKEEVWKVILDDDSHIIATSNHKFILRNGEKRALKDLKENDSLLPFNSYISNNRYRQIAESSLRKKQFGWHLSRRQYRLIYEYFNGKIDEKNQRVHHNDYNSLNDRIENLHLCTEEEHKKFHDISGKNNPMFKLKDPESYSKHMSVAVSGLKNGRAFDISDEEWFAKCQKYITSFKEKPTRRKLHKFCKENKLPISEYRIGTVGCSSWEQFIDVVHNQTPPNHKIKKIEFYGYEDVYNMTVDDNHNYVVLTSRKDDNYITSSGVCVCNCGEQPLPAWGNCNLGSINLTKFVKWAFTSRAEFDWETFKTTVKHAVRFLDNVNELSVKYKLFPFQEQIDESSRSRRIGLGVMGLADMFVTLGIKYDTDKAIDFVRRLFETMRNTAYEYSCEIGKEKGSFKMWDYDKWLKSKFVQNLPDYIRDKAKSGLRNLTLLSIAPTGSIALLAGVSSSTEPIFSLEYHRTVNLGDTGQGQTLKFYHPLYKKFLDKKYETAEGIWTTAHNIDWKFRIRMQGVIQQYVCTAISNTVNLSSSVSEQNIYDIYMTAWKEGLKGITIYRDGCRENILSTKKSRPYELIGKTYQIKDENEDTFYITINNILEGVKFRPFEIFINSKESNEYLNVITRLLSAIFRRTSDSEFVIKQLQKSSKKENGLLLGMAQVISDHMGLKQQTCKPIVNNDTHILQEIKVDGFQICPQCGKKTLKKEGGCEECVNPDCGFGKCSI